MKGKKWLAGLLAAVLLSGLLSLTVTAASGAGTEDDPLVTLSYLKETFLNDMMKKVDEKIAARTGQAGDSSSATFSVVTLSKGQVLTGDIGCEVLLRVGTAVCVSPSSPGLIDETGASTLNNGSALVQNHLYMMTIEGRGVKATAATTKLMVRGGYSIA